jgi:hypothetical protein
MSRYQGVHNQLHPFQPLSSYQVESIGKVQPVNVTDARVLVSRPSSGPRFMTSDERHQMASFAAVMNGQYRPSQNGPTLFKSVPSYQLMQQNMTAQYPLAQTTAGGHIRPAKIESQPEHISTASTRLDQVGTMAFANSAAVVTPSVTDCN